MGVLPDLRRVQGTSTRRGSDGVYRIHGFSFYLDRLADSVRAHWRDRRLTHLSLYSETGDETLGDLEPVDIISVPVCWHDPIR